MTKPSIERLNNLILNTGKTDPLFLLELAPLIPDYLVPRAIKVTLDINNPDNELRTRTVKNLAERLKNVNEALIEEALDVANNATIDTGQVNMSLLVILAPIMPARLVYKAAELAYKIKDFNTRIEVLTILAKRLPIKDQRLILSLIKGLKAEIVTDLPSKAEGQERSSLSRTKQPVRIRRTLKSGRSGSSGMSGIPGMPGKFGRTLSSGSFEKYQGPSSNKTSAQVVKAKEMLQNLSQEDREKFFKKWLVPSKDLPLKHPTKDVTTRIRSGRKMKEGPSESIPEQMFDEKISEALPPIQANVVNTGFSDSGQAGRSLKETTLACGRSYYFWLDISNPDSFSIEENPIPIPVEYLPSEALLKVALFGFDDEILITKGADIGELRLLPAGSAVVKKQPELVNDLIPTELIKRRLFFPVTAPSKTGVARLRCNIYYDQILVQSRLIKALVMDQPHPVQDALSSVVDYNLSYTLLPAHLTQLKTHKLSLMLNTSDGNTHAVIFGGKGDTLFNQGAVLLESELKKPLENARKAMRTASWGDPDPYTNQKYKYKDQKLDLDRLTVDVFALARRGFTLYNALIDKLTGSREVSDQLARLMLKPGMVQIALNLSPNQILPSALFYDYPLDTQASQPKLCNTFISALKNDEPLEKSPCFKGACPNYKKLDYICPSGFWGFRHFLGTPVSVGGAEDQIDVTTRIVVNGKTEIVTGVATNLDQVNDHMKKLQSLSTNIGWHYSENRLGIIDLLKKTKPHIIYFYCHGILSESETLFLQVGNSDEYIDGSILRAENIKWNNPRPLVFINGCRTAALDPDNAINLVQDFIGSGGAGVIGTEITIFESLACSFAEEFLRLFLFKKLSLGASVRNARLKLLKEGNPLGLLYTPFVIPSLHVEN